jgi:hypothetical protein
MKKEERIYVKINDYGREENTPGHLKEFNL